MEGSPTSIRFMSFRERAEELNKISEKFHKGRFPTTARWIRKLSKTIQLSKVTIEEVVEDLKDIEQTFRVEFVGSDENTGYRERCFDEFRSIVLRIIDEEGPKELFKALERVHPALRSGGQALQNLAEIYSALVASKNLSEKRRYYGLCFMYLISVEGLYDEDMRTLHILKKAGEGVSINYREIQQKPLWFFKKELEPVFFEGYNNRIRNAIAHARFRFDNEKNKMIFKDTGKKNQPEYEVSLSLKEFHTKYYEKIDSFFRLRTFYLFFLAIRDLALAPKPFGKTTLSP